MAWMLEETHPSYHTRKTGEKQALLVNTIIISILIIIIRIRIRIIPISLSSNLLDMFLGKEPTAATASTRWSTPTREAIALQRNYRRSTSCCYSERIARTLLQYISRTTSSLFQRTQHAVWAGIWYVKY